MKRYFYPGWPKIPNQSFVGCRRKSPTSRKMEGSVMHHLGKGTIRVSKTETCPPSKPQAMVCPSWP